MAEGYESFFSCTRTSERGRAGYSGVATFCRVESAFNSDEVALPVAAEEGFSGLIGEAAAAEGLEEFSKEELLEVDGEGRFAEIWGGNVGYFCSICMGQELEATIRKGLSLSSSFIRCYRWEALLRHGRRVIVVGDLNIAPTCLDRCEAEPDFEKNQFRKWFRSMLMENGGSFIDVFRAKHPDRDQALTL